MTDRELMQQALEALETQKPFWVWTAYRCEPLEIQDAITALRNRLAQPNEFNPDWDAIAVMVEEQQRMAKRIAELEAQPEQKHTGFIDSKINPIQRPWVGLTDKEAMQICVDCGCMSEDWLMLLDAIEAKLKEKNT